jgi:OOP family OmpA-OmpF porin
MRSRTFILSAVIAVSGLLAAHGAFAQDSDAQKGEFSVQRFEPAPGPRNFVTVEGARVRGKMAWSAGLFANYAYQPFVVRSCVSKTNCDQKNAINQNDVAVVRDLFTADLMGSLSIIEKLQIGLRVPLTYTGGDGIDTTTGQPAQGGFSGFGVGDPYLEGKYRFFGAWDSPLTLAGGLFFTGPVGHAAAEGKYIGYSSPVAGGRAIADFRVDKLSLGANLAALYRGEAKLGSTTLGPEFRYGVGAGYQLSPVVRVLAEGYGGTKFSTLNGTNSMEALGAFQITPLQSPFAITAGGGGGVIQGVGVPMFRGFVGLMYVHEPSDRDGDGIDDDKDQCPTVPEDLDNFEDTDGCPDLDNDNDTIPDDRDKCPNQPETVNGYKDEDGCPDDVPDRDKDGIQDAEDKCPDQGGKVIRVKGPNYGCPDSDEDGIPDSVDKCPNEKEDTDGFQDEDGCPDPDEDGDGVMDVDDECPQQPGTKENKGCPEKDRDNDGIIDRLDKCPDKPENYNGYQDDDGCPDNKPTLVTQTGDAIEIKGSIEFETNSDKIVGNKSFAILDGVAALMTHNMRIQQVEVGGHTDDRGGADNNMKLSQRRAEAVRTYLIGKGVAADRLTAVGYGQTKPIADNKSAAGRQKNRRVEFKILKQAPAQR